jgi:hypothetical protein
MNMLDRIEVEERCDLSDAGAKMRITEDGYLVASPRIARTGIQLYSGHEVGRDDLEVVRVYRPAEQVFDKAAMASLAWRPVTLDHPDDAVTAKNWKQLAVGYVTGKVARDGDYIEVPLALMDHDAITAVQNGHAQLSVGYGAKLVWGDGVTPAGEPYHAVQTDIRANHVAVVKMARGGDKLKIGDDKTGDREFSTAEREAAAEKGQAMPGGGFPIKSEKDLKNAIQAVGRAKDPAAAKAHIKKRAKALGLTSLIPKQWGDTAPRKETNMSVKTIDGVNIELEDKDGQILDRYLGGLQSKLADNEKKVGELTAQVVALGKTVETKDGEIIGLNKKLADAEWTPQKRDQAIRDSMEIFDRARRVLGDKLVTDGKSDIQIKREVVAAEIGDEEAKAMSDEAIAGVFSAVTRQVKKDGFQRTVSALSQPLSAASNLTPSQAAYAKYVDSLNNAYKAKSA